MSVTPSAVTPLGIPGFTFADLHEPARLADLHHVFVAEVRGDRTGPVGALDAPIRAERG